jgi:hypothetical protein
MKLFAYSLPVIAAILLTSQAKAAAGSQIIYDCSVAKRVKIENQIESWEPVGQLNVGDNSSLNDVTIDSSKRLKAYIFVLQAPAGDKAILQGSVGTYADNGQITTYALTSVEYGSAILSLTDSDRGVSIYCKRTN